MMKSMNILLEDPEILSLYEKKYETELKKYRVFTENPFVYEFLSQKGHENVVTLDSLIDNRETINEISKEAFAVAIKWIDILNDRYDDEFEVPVMMGNVLAVYLYNLTSTCFYRFYQLIDIVSKYGSLVFPFIDKKETVNKLISIVDNNLFARLCSIDSFRKKISLQNLKSDKKNRDVFYEVDSNITINNYLYYLLALCTLPSASHGLKIRFAKVFCRLFFSKNVENIRCVILNKGPVITELTSFLLSKGISIEDFKMPKIPESVYDTNVDDDTLSEKLVNSLAEQDFPYPEMVHSPRIQEMLHLLAKTTATFASSYLVPVTLHLYSVINPLLSKKEAKDKHVLLSGTRSMETSIIRAIFAHHDIPTIQFQEGTSCLLRLFQNLVQVGYLNEGDAFISFAPHEENYFKNFTKNSTKIFSTYGASEIMKAPMPKIGKIIGRKIWKVLQKDRLILYVPTRYRGKVVRPYYELLDIGYWRYQKNLIHDVFSVVSDTVCIKIHKKGLLSTTDQREYPFDLLSLPNNIIVKQGPDLRFMRVAADLIIVDTATSTLSWALLSGVPVVYMNHSQSPLEEDVRLDMQSAIFVIDVDNQTNCWKDELLKILTLPANELAHMWKSMHKRRELFLKEYITGFPRKKEDILEWIKFVTYLGYKKLSSKYNK